MQTMHFSALFAYNKSLKSAFCQVCFLNAFYTRTFQPHQHKQSEDGTHTFFSLNGREPSTTMWTEKSIFDIAYLLVHVWSYACHRFLKEKIIKCQCKQSPPLRSLSRTKCSHNRLKHGLKALSLFYVLKRAIHLTTKLPFSSLLMDWLSCWYFPSQTKDSASGTAWVNPHL